MWLDLVDDVRPVPAFNGNIILKVSRLSFDEASRQKVGGGRPVTESSTPAPRPAPAAAPPAAAPRPSPAAPPPSSSAAAADLLGISDFTDGPSQQPSLPPSSSSTTGGYDPFGSQAPLFDASSSGSTARSAGLPMSSGLTPVVPSVMSGGATARPPMSAGPAASPALWTGSSSPRGIPYVGGPMAGAGMPSVGVMAGGPRMQPTAPAPAAPRPTNILNAPFKM